MRTKDTNLMEKIVKSVDDWYDVYQKSPTLRELASDLEVSPATILRYIRDMAAHGMLAYDGCRILTDKIEKCEKDMSNIALVGSIACGQPLLAEEHIEHYFRLPISMTGRGEFFFLEAHGDSMVDAGIDDGDLVLIRISKTARAGQIVVAMVDGETTLKRYYPEPENQRVRLHPENSSMQDFYVDHCEIQGIAEKVWKDII